MKNLKAITDKDLIVFLVASNLEIKDIKKDGNRSIVYFLNDDEFKNTIMEYANKSKTINIADYLAAEKRVITLLYAQKQI